MKTHLFITCIGCLLHTLKAQDTILVGDTCAENYTKYEKINDSTYYVLLQYGETRLFESHVFRPKVFVHLGLNMYDWRVDTDFHGLVLDSICIWRNLLGEIIELRVYKNRKLDELKRYKKDTLAYHEYSRNGIEYRIEYDHGKISFLEKFFPDKHLLIRTIGKETSKYRTGKTKNELLYIFGNKSITKDRTSPERKTITYFHDKTFIVRKQETYNKKRLSYLEEFDLKRRPVKIIHYDLKGKINDTKEFVYEEDSNFRRISSNYISPRNPQKNNSEVYSIYKKQAVVEYSSNERYYRVAQANDTLSLTSIDNSPVKSADSFRLNLSGTTAFFCQRLNDYEIRSITLGYQLNPYFQSIFHDHNNSYQIHSLAQDFSYSIEELKEIERFMLYSNHSGQRTDSIFMEGRLQHIIHFNKDTTILYGTSNGLMKLQYHSHYLHIAKDQELCNLGLKTPDGQWLNSDRFEDMDIIHLGNQHYHVGHTSGYISVYDWSGRKMFGPLFGIPFNNYEFGKLPIFFSYDKTQGDTSFNIRILLWLDNTQDSIFGFVDTNGRVIYQSNHRIRLEYRNSMPLEDGWLIENNNRFGYADFNRVIIPPIYVSISRTENGHFIVSDSLGYFLIDSNGRQIFSERYATIENNQDSNTVVFKGKNIVAYNTRTLAKVFERSNVDLDYFNSDFYKLKDKMTGKSGLIGRGFNFKTETIYDEIVLHHQTIVCRKGKTHEFYTNYYKIQNTLLADTIYFSPRNISYWNNSHHYYDVGSNYSSFRYIFGLNKKLGLLNIRGEIILPALYNSIGYDDLHNCYGLTDTLIDFYGKGGKLQRKEEAFPRVRFTVISEWTTHSRLKVLDWKGNEIKMPIDELRNLTPTLYSISRNGSVTGFMNQKGEMKFNIDSVHSILYRRGYYYFMNKRQKAGIMSCRFSPILQSDYLYISDLFQDRYVWLSNAGPTEHPSQNLPVGTWRLMDIKTMKMLEDTFYNPTTLNNRYSIVKNKNGRLGILDSNLQYVRKCIYTKYMPGDMGGELVFQKADSSMDIFTHEYQYLKTINYELLSPVTNGYLGFKAGTTYKLDAGFNVIDSSANMFADRDSSVFYLDSADLYNYFEMYADWRDKTKINDEHLKHWQKNLPGSVYNFYQSILAIQNKAFGNNIYSCPVHFLPTQERYYDYYDRFDYHPRDFNIIYFARTVSHGPLYLNYSDFTSENADYQIEGYKDNFFTLSKEEPGYQGERIYRNYYLGDKGVYEINLLDLIDTDKRASFENLLLKNVNALDDPEAPCLKKDDLLNTYSNSFIFGLDGLVIIIDYEYQFIISYEELMPFMKKEWKK